MKSIKIIGVILTIFCFVFSFILIIPMSTVAYGVHYNNIDMSNKSKNEVVKIVKSSTSQMPKHIELTDIKGHTEKFALADLGVELDVDKTVDKVMNYGNQSSVLERVKSRLDAFFNQTNIKPEVKVNATTYDGFIKNYSKSIGLAESNGSFKLDGEKAIFVLPNDGKFVDKDTLIDAVKNKIINNSSQAIKVTLKEIKDGKELMANNLKKINTVLGTFTTYYDEGAVQRSHNIHISSDKINGIVIEPNGLFSYNNILGERTSEAGYESAPVIINGKLVPGIGGGICQLSSTLHMAALYAGMDIVERTNHFSPVAYIPAGYDATVAYGSLDYIFKNPFKNPIYIMTEYGNGTLTVYILGSEEDKLQEVRVYNTAEQVIPNKTITREDKTLKKDKIEEEGNNGLSLITVREKIDKNGEIIRDSYESFYDPVDKIIIKAPKEDKKTEPTAKVDKANVTANNKTAQNNEQKAVKSNELKNTSITIKDLKATKNINNAKL